MRCQRVLAKLLLSGVVILFSSFLFQLFVTDFSCFDYITFDVGAVGNYEERFSDNVKPMFEECGLDFFIVSVTPRTQQTTYSVYCNNDVLTKLKENGYYEGRFKCILGTDIAFEYHSLEEYTKRSSVNVTENIYFLNLDSVKVNAYIDENAVRVTKKERNYYQVGFVVIWGLWLVLFLILEGVNVAFQKKQWLLEICHGRPVKRVLLREIIKVIGCSLASLLIWGVLLHRFICTQYMMATWIVAIACYCIVTTILIGGTLFFANYKVAFQKNIYSLKLIVLCRMEKYTLMGVSVVLFSLCFMGISRYIELLAEKPFYENFTEYSNIVMGFDYGDDSKLETCFTYDDEMYAEKHTEWGLIYWNYRGIELPFCKTDCIVSNKNAEKLLVQIGLDTSGCKSEMAHLFLPESMRGIPEEEVKILVSHLSNGPDDIDFDVLFYCEEISSYVFCGPESEVEMVHNPIVLWMNYSEYDSSFIDAYGYLCDWIGVAGLMTEEEFTGYCLSNSHISGYSIENVYDRYLQRVSDCLVQTFLCLALGIITLFLDIISLRVLIGIEQEMRAMEIAVMKVSGTPVVVRYAEVLLTIFESALLGILMAYVVSTQVEGLSIGISLFVAMGLLILEIFLMLNEFIKWERTSIMKILKGGAL